MSYSIQAAEDSNARLSKWFKPFFTGQIGGAVHPYFHEEPWGGQKRNRASRLEAVEPKPPPEVARKEEGVFRICIRTWDDDVEDDGFAPMPDLWLYRMRAPDADAAREMAIERFPKGAVVSPVFSDDGEIRLDHRDIARLSIDVQRVGLKQSLKAHSSFHVIGSIGDDLPASELPRFAGYLAEVFPAAVLGTEDQDVHFAVSIHAESNEEAEADLHEAVEAFMDAAGLEGEPLDEYSSGPGGFNVEDLWREIAIDRWRRKRR